ncbi:MAG: hypothetical protein GF310_13025 [candidate division Zixibacteria bacterium]|nr:hypothetical protein [candidate division Zixibacteria bacterium]
MPHLRNLLFVMIISLLLFAWHTKADYDAIKPESFVREASWNGGCSYKFISHEFTADPDKENLTSKISKQFGISILKPDLNFRNLISSAYGFSFPLDSVIILAEYEFDFIPEFLLFRFLVNTNDGAHYPDVFIGHIVKSGKSYLLSNYRDDLFLRRFDKMVSENSIFEKADPICLASLVMALKYNRPYTVVLDSEEDIEFAAMLIDNQTDPFRAKIFNGKNFLYFENIGSLDSTKMEIENIIAESKDIYDSAKIGELKNWSHLNERELRAATDIIIVKAVSDFKEKLRQDGKQITGPIIEYGKNAKTVILTTLNSFFGEVSEWKIVFEKTGRIHDMLLLDKQNLDVMKGFHARF